MSLNHSKCLKTLPSERRVAATFPSTQQLNRLREDLSPLTDTLEKLIELHDKEHPNTIIAATTGKDDQDQQQPTKAERYHPYL
ncbi:MAG: hypothetical protein WA631_02235 [Nitrososphaeraceae archaeon]